ncbi:MAG: hypothetical protein EHM59_03610 [Betaproteobacteria bacterium]|nr:MAG: hypothetical protein EHM59_03610 [Betaproteobacteria bacterium]
MVIYIEDFLLRRRSIAPVHALRLVAAAGGHPKAGLSKSLAARLRSSPSIRALDLPTAPDVRTLYAEATLI